MPYFYNAVTNICRSAVIKRINLKSTLMLVMQFKKMLFGLEVVKYVTVHLTLASGRDKFRAGVHRNLSNHV